MSASESTQLKACRPCSKAKVRCDPGPSVACQRCHRLGKDCIKQAPRFHKLKHNNMSYVDVGRLERKLDNVTSLLTASRRYAEGINSHANVASPAREVVWVSEPSDQETEDMLKAFHQSMALFFPFLVRSPSLTAHDLRTQKPLLRLVIPVIFYKNVSSQQAHAVKSREYWMEQLLVKGEHGLDLFQGLLMFIGWTQLTLPMPRVTLVNNYLHLLEAQVNNLDFRGDSKSGMTGSVFSYLKDFGLDERLRDSRTLEELRAYLGCFYLVTMVSLCLDEKDPMRYTDYTEECCRAVEAAAEFESDKHLIQLVRIAQMAAKIHRTLNRHEIDVPNGSASTAMIIRLLQKDMQQLRDSLTCEFPQSAIVFLHYHTLELMIYRTAMTKLLHDHPIPQIDVLCACVEATKSFFDTFFTIPSHLYLQLPYTIWVQLGHGLAILSRILIHSDPRGNWDREYARQRLNFDATADTFGLKVEEAISQAAAEDIEMPPIFTQIKNRVVMWKEGHAARCATLDRWNQDQPQAIAPGMDELIPDVDVDDMLMTGSIWNFFSL
ncbi:hypothetical protein BO70DRAFT_298207 [Aspergillus heteromorphus CBS 117.55]|uniref:Zn(2)-C6 fungal-type domain-containing protein n=1 Tax=Aspergillus heteromorphus CBS 117.55 TaxID=1448321 RepID=A0A317VFP5_9EURO|nr:uncharacterized protein BO70DRAFT_298207 [Aspergillus heteromorphus CBS 117.55]PWY71712.1 hypothetical protein BO70DRAFT_298207 [Aspergillus heteromorphus CBS 117.55]